MNTPGLFRITVTFAVFVGLTVGGLIAIEGLFRDRTEDLNAMHRLHLASRRSDWEKDAAGRVVDEQRAGQQRLVRRHEEMVLALGGPVAAAAKNPDADLAGMLRAICGLCVGNQSATQLSVERFTEFNLAVDLDLVPSGQSPEEILLCVLRHGSAYVNRMRFHRRGLIVAELDRRAIESISDWGAASLDTVRQLVAEMDEVRGVVATPVAIRPSPAGRDEDEGNMSHRSQLSKQALTRLGDAVSNSIQAINQAVRLQTAALGFENARGVNEITTARAQLLESGQILGDARAFFGDPAEFYRRVMVEVGLDRLYIDAELRSRRLLDAVNAPLALEIIAKAERRGRTAGQLLQVMGDALGTWTYDRLTRNFQFDSPQTAAAYRAAADQLSQDAAELDAALVRWSRGSR